MGRTAGIRIGSRKIKVYRAWNRAYITDKIKMRVISRKIVILDHFLTIFGVRCRNFRCFCGRLKREGARFQTFHVSQAYGVSLYFQVRTSNRSIERFSPLKFWCFFLKINTTIINARSCWDIFLFCVCLSQQKTLFDRAFEGLQDSASFTVIIPLEGYFYHN